MIKRTMKTAMILGMLVVLITNFALPVLATESTNEVKILEDFIIEVKNPTDTDYIVRINIAYYNKSGDKIYTKDVRKDIKSFETIAVDAKEYYASENIYCVNAEVVREYDINTHNFFQLFLIIWIISLIIGILVTVIVSTKRKSLSEGGMALIVLSVLAIIFTSIKLL